MRRAAILALLGAVLAGPAQAAGPTVKTANGVLEGAAVADGAVAAFLGVPYAKPPVGDLRWKPPELAAPWTGVRPALEAGQACMQPNAGPRGFYTDPPARMGEDCLHLNVWAPKGVKNAPVMLFIHGGALVTGQGGSPRYDGTKLAQQGVVVVTINYRLGIFGYFAHPELSAESPHRASGNYGTLDQIAALRWVQQNIAAFGGDPKRVTVFGQSAGGQSVSVLMASPLSAGLFQRAIAQSGYLIAIPELRRARFGLPAAEDAGAQFGRTHDAPTLAALRAIPAERLLTIAADNPNNSFGAASPVVDGWVQKAQIFETFEAGREAKVPFIAGFTSGEMKSFDPGALPTPPSDAAGYEARARALYGPAAADYLKVYPAADFAESNFAGFRDAYFGWGTERLLQLHVRNGQPGWLYYFDHVYPSAAERGVGAFHSSDVPFVFANVGPNALAPKNWPAPPVGAEDADMAKAVMAYWTAFAATGQPDAKGQHAWPAFTTPDGGYLLLQDGRAIAAKALLPGMFGVQEAQMTRLRAAGTAWTWANTGLGAAP